jgi:hypothetical protein
MAGRVEVCQRGSLLHRPALHLARCPLPRNAITASGLPNHLLTPLHSPAIPPSPPPSLSLSLSPSLRKTSRLPAPEEQVPVGEADVGEARAELAEELVVHPLYTHARTHARTHKNLCTKSRSEFAEKLEVQPLFIYYFIICVDIA